MARRTNYDENEFITANIIPFQSDSTFDTTDTTLRVDRGKSFRTDKSTFLYTMAFTEGGSADIGVNVAGNCRGKDFYEHKSFRVWTRRTWKIRKVWTNVMVS